MSIMTDTTSVSVLAKNAGAKPRLSLLSSKQSQTRLKSEEDPPDHSEGIIPNEGLPSNGLLKNTDVSTAFATLAITTELPTGSKSATLDHGPKDSASFTESDLNESSALKQTSQGQSSDQQRKAFDTLGVSKKDLIALLSMLKSELQSKELALASMKLEQLKRLINPVEISRSALARTYIELQDRLKAKEQLNENSAKRLNNSTNSSASNETNNEKSKHGLNFNLQDDNNNNNNDKNMDDSDEETIEILSSLLELLDRHPLLALPRDSIYCLDYNCNEQSTKTYLNLKIQHLENLIDQHRKFRYLMKERLKRSEQRSIDLTVKLELERKYHIQNERSAYRNNAEATLLGHIERLKEELERERVNKHSIVMTLLGELIEEREKNETLSGRVLELEDRLRVADGNPQQASFPPMTNQQSVCKPRVPAKPPQLFFTTVSRNQK